jgi:hypothetical protein
MNQTLYIQRLNVIPHLQGHCIFIVVSRPKSFTVTQHCCVLCSNAISHSRSRCSMFRSDIIIINELIYSIHITELRVMELTRSIILKAFQNSSTPEVTMEVINYVLHGDGTDQKFKTLMMMMCRIPCSGMWHRVDLAWTDVAEELQDRKIRERGTTVSRWLRLADCFYPEEGGDKFLRNVGSRKIYKAPHPRRRNSS